MEFTDEHLSILTETESRSKNNARRLDGIERQTEEIHRIATAVEVMAAEQKHQTDDIKDVKSSIKKTGDKIDDLERKPAKRWESVVEKVLLTAVGAVVAYLLAKAGLV